MEGDFYSNSIRETRHQLDQMPSRVTQGTQQTDPDLYESLRRLSRSRVAFLLRQLRAAHGLSYAQVQANTGLSQQLLFDVEFKEHRLSLDELRALAACYKASVSDILGVDIE
jgi:uncharacterized protein (DUF3084 family)